jgi:pentatricopeptide repeat protein
VITFNTVIAAYAEKRDVASAAAVLDDMPARGVEPNERTYGERPLSPHHTTHPPLAAAPCLSRVRVRVWPVSTGRCLAPPSRGEVASKQY